MQRRIPRIECGEALWRCPRCDRWKPARDYYRATNAWNGLAGLCKPCVLEIQKAGEHRKAKAAQPDEAA